MNHHDEIERRFLIEQLPSGINQTRFEDIIQYYVRLDATAKKVTRFRKIGGRFYRTEKSGHGLVRRETEFEINQANWVTHWSSMIGQEIVKLRFYYLGPNGLTFEVDLFLGQLKGLKMVEVEFLSETEARQFIPPDWFGREVTDDLRYNNFSLAVYGRPGH